MAGTIQIQSITVSFLIALTLSGSVFAATEPNAVLVSYSFDDTQVETGPDTFAVYEKSKGTVSLSSAFPFSGYHSIEIKDFADDGDFPELQGYFPLQKDGVLYAHFSFLITNPAEPLNMALAGPKWFRVQKDGIGFWLLTRNGYLYHYSDSMPKKLFPITAFVWYTVELSYDIRRGRYDLTIYLEGQPDPVVDLKNQANTANAPLSAVDKFSFIGDLNDKSNAVYYVDDVIITNDKQAVIQPLIAPGRRKLFFDYWLEYQRRLRDRPVCLPVQGLEDIGLNNDNSHVMQPDGAMTALMALLAGKSTSIDKFSRSYPETFSLFKAIKTWRKGCVALAAGNSLQAITLFNNALTLVNAPIYKLSYVLALAAAGKRDELNLFLAEIYSDWYGDARFIIAQAMIAFANKDWFRAGDALLFNATKVYLTGIKTKDRPGLKQRVNQLWAGKLDGDLLAALKKELPNTWSQTISDYLIAEQYYYLLLWTQRITDAISYAKNMVEHLSKNQLPTSIWLERIGDGHFMVKNYQGAMHWYQTSLAKGHQTASIYKKMSDIYFKQGNVQKEREYRQKIYGSLKD